MRATLVLAVLAGPLQAQSPPCTTTPDSAMVRGTVVDARTGLPIRNVEVSVTWRLDPADRPITHEVDTDEAGRFSLCDVPTNTRVFVSAEFFGNLSRIPAAQLQPNDTLDATLEVESPRARVVGRVLNESNQPIAAATVTVGADGPKAVSGQDGRFTFAGIPPGRFPVAVSHVAFTDVADSIGVELGTLITMNVRMAPTVIPLAPIVVEARSLRLQNAGFYDRRERGIGSYVTRPEILATLARQASDVLRRQPGMRLVRRTSGFGYVVVGRGECPFRYFVDGTRVGPTFQIDDVDVDWIEAIEIYRGPASVPIEFMLPPTEQNANCGIIAIWTRVR